MQNPEKMLSFKKPPGPLKVWEVIEKVNKDGRTIKFTIQEIPEDRYEDAIEHMDTYFLADEPTCQCLNVKNDPIFVEESNVIWRNMLKQGISIAAFVDNSDGGKPIIAGLNMLAVDFKKNEFNIDDYNFTSQNITTIFKNVAELTKKAKVYEHYEVDRYMYALGLSVAPEYRGYALGADILRCREKIGREYNIPVTCTSFTSPVSCKLATRVQFELLLAKDYVDMVHEDGKPCFPGIKSDTLKVMAKKLY